jgi:hypothetical protein
MNEVSMMNRVGTLQSVAIAFGALAFAAFMLFTPVQVSAQGAPSECVTSSASGDPMDAYAIVLGTSPDRETAMARAAEFSATLGKDARVFARGSEFITVVCGDWMEKDSANSMAMEAESALQYSGADVQLFKKQ